MERQPSLPKLAPGAAERTLEAIEQLRARSASPRVVLRRPEAEGPLRAWAAVLAIAAAAFLLLLAVLYVVSQATISRPSL